MKVPRVLIVLGHPGWSAWLPEFLAAPSLSTQLVAPAGDRKPGGNAIANADAVLFLSHHDTLQQDAAAAEQIRAMHAVPLSCQPRTVALLATDKLAMAEVARRVPGLSPIDAIRATEAVRLLRNGEALAIVEKRIGATEGQGMRIHRSCDLVNIEDRPGSLLQPFVAGTEFSVNLVCRGEQVLAFEPVHKGETSLDGTHPCRRERLCPSPSLAPDLRLRILGAATAYAREIGADGLVEIELVVRGTTIHLLEVNPRLAATMRLSSVACGRSIFVELQRSVVDPTWRGGLVPAVRFAGEVPIGSGEHGECLMALAHRMPLWHSSRATTAADTFPLLRARLDEIRTTLAHAG